MGRSALATDGADGSVTVMDGKGERSDIGVVGEGELVGSHANAITAEMRRAARTDSMVSDGLLPRVRDSATKYYMNCYVKSAPKRP